MKRKILIPMLIFVLTLITTTNALASSPTKSWNSGTCLRSFTTTNATSKDSGYWTKFKIFGTAVSFDSAVPKVYAKATPVNKNGNPMGLYKEIKTQVPADDDYEIVCNANSGYKDAYLLIENPYSPSNGPNMRTSGHFYGEYQ